jgi:hypothetical protein
MKKNKGRDSKKGAETKQLQRTDNSALMRFKIKSTNKSKRAV